jgi:hypothetical protein
MTSAKNSLEIEEDDAPLIRLGDLNGKSSSSLIRGLVDRNSSF